jgi:predicted metalloprotease with PDZ domain
VFPRGASSVRVRYRVFANTLSGTFSVADTAHVNWNGASLFMYVVGHKPDPVHLTISPPAGWHVINGSSTTPDQLEFSFPDYDHLIDTPTEVAPHFDVDSFNVDGRLYRVLVHHNGSEHGQRERVVRDVEKIVRYENRVIAPPPLEMYTFMFNIGYRGRDGMEHLYSTQIVVPRPWTDDTMSIMPTLSDAAHEYFHTWNVKRVRPIALGPFDYAHEQYEPSLWVAEGWTQYYGEIGLLRAGIIDKSSYYRTLGGVIRVNEDTPGAREVSARMSSFEAPFWDAATSAMATDRSDAWVSYYLKGEALATLLDLKIRARTHNARSLDDALRTLKHVSWDAPKATYYLQGRGYTEEDVVYAVSQAMGMDMHPWFAKYVGGVERLPWAETLALAGMQLTVRDTPRGHAYEVSEMPNASAEQLRVRQGWLSGTSGSTPASMGQ